MQSIESKILAAIRAVKHGKLLFPEDFHELGSAEAIRLALHRLEKKNKITRVAHGIYVRPVMSKYIGKVLPTAEEVAEGIASRDKARTVPTGTYALHALGLSTQVPMNIVLLTDGSPRDIRVGNRTIKFKKTTPKNLLAKGKISRLVIQALKEIGKDQQTEAEEKKIIELLKKEKQQDLLYDIPLAPVWIREIMKKALHE
jgi:predicted transcriptional regulator of viral defense system